MTASNLSACLAETLKHEGGWADHPKDPGGATMKGITIGTYRAWKGRQVTKSELRNISDAEVREIYRRQYWDKVGGDLLPDGFDQIAFDGAVNSGVSRGARWLQAGLGMSGKDLDGIVGAKTIGRARTAPDGTVVIRRACAARMGFLGGLRNWKVFGRGWTRRVASIEATAIAMNTRSRIAVAGQGKQAGNDSRKQTTGAAGSGAAAVGGSGIENIPDPLVFVIIGLSLMVTLILLSKARVSRARAAAFKQKAKEMQA